jgi:presenilin-like A22 family membrane protease
VRNLLFDVAVRKFCLFYFQTLAVPVCSLVLGLVILQAFVILNEWLVVHLIQWVLADGHFSVLDNSLVLTLDSLFQSARLAPPWERGVERLTFLF